MRHDRPNPAFLGQEIGRQAMAHLVKILSGERISDRRMLLPTELIVRGSTTAPRRQRFSGSVKP
jgi:hypothetical protein